MLKKMRWRFICSAMAAFTAVVLALFMGINVWNYTSVVRQQDNSLNSLNRIYSGGDQMPPGQPLPAKYLPPGRDMPFLGAFPAFSPEVQYMIRFFAVYCDDDGEIQGINHDFIASVTESDAAEYTEQVLKSGKDLGFYNGYRYAVYKTDSGKTVIFLNSERELQGIRYLILQNGLIALCCLTAVFLLVVLFSKRAIAPYVRNIETQKRFITDAGHALKTPLTSISASADVLASEYENDEWIQNIQSQSLRMSKLIGNLVTLSRLDEEQPFPERTEFSLSDAVWEISEPMASLAEAKGKEYIQHIEDDVVMTVDRNAIQQMVSILLDNAVKYSDEHGKIRLELVREKRKILISVYNTCLMEPHIDAERLFDRFYRADRPQSDRTGGTGIGLSIAKAIAEAHGGKTSVKCTGGSIFFTVRL